MENVTVNVFDTALLRARYPEWDALTKQERFTLLQHHLPDRTITQSNVTCVGLHEWLAQEVNPEINMTDEVADFALGNGGGATSASDTALNNRVAMIDVADAEYDALNAESHFSTFVDSTEANGYTLDELGLYSKGGRLLNHAAIDPAVSKSSSETLVIEVILAFA